MPAGLPGRTNRGRLLDVLRRQGPTPRVALARDTRLSFAAISAITSKLISAELLREGEAETGLLAGGIHRAPAETLPDNEGRAEELAEGAGGQAGLASLAPDASRRRGRPAVELRLNPDFGRVVAVSLRMNLIETLIADFSGAPLAQSLHVVATRALEANALLRLVIEQITLSLETSMPRTRLLGIGLALQGIVNPDLGRHLWSPALSITDVDVVKPLQQAFDVPVVIANDAVAIALAVVAREPALAHGLSATIKVGHGVGMGVLVDGELASGDGGVGREIGHLKLAPDGPQCRCGQRGCIEAYLADYALYRDARTIVELPPAEAQQPSEAQMEMLRARALDGEPRLQPLFRQAGRALADAVAATVSLLRPHHVILTGPGLQAFPLMHTAYDERLGEALLPWLQKRTAIHIRPSATATAVDGMVRRTLQMVDRHLLELAAPGARDFTVRSEQGDDADSIVGSLD